MQIYARDHVDVHPQKKEKGGVMKNGQLKGGGSCKYMPVIM